MLKLVKGNNIRILCNTTAFERVKEISENTVIKSSNVEHFRNKDEKGGYIVRASASKKRSQGEIK